MQKRTITCIECPIGCAITVSFDGDNVANIEGNTCPRGALYAKNEIICPRRVVTTTVKTTDGRMMAVKTDRPIKKSQIFYVMQKIRTIITEPKSIGEVVFANISEDINLVCAQELDF